MKNQKLLHEIYWLAAIMLSAAIIEYAVIDLLDMHPIVSLKVQGFIGLVLIGYGIRMVARLWASGNGKVSSKQNGHLE